MFQFTFPYSCIETERTLWVPWTIEHTKEWETTEQKNTAPSLCRRNDYFETNDALIMRDANWLKLCNYIHEMYGDTIFPDLGYAILRKTDQQLIGTIRLKLNNQTSMSFTYGLRPEVHNCKFGQEIIKAFLTFIDHYIGSSMIAFKDGINKTIFMAEWRKEGKKENPDFTHLISLFELGICEKIIGSVDIKNQASLAILMRNNMQPFNIECAKYTCDDNNNLFAFDILIRYPHDDCMIQPNIEQFIADLLSRDQHRIEQVHNTLKTLFNIPNHWTYMQLTLGQKAVFTPLCKTMILLSDINTIKRAITHAYYPPYCFVR